MASAKMSCFAMGSDTIGYNPDEPNAYTLIAEEYGFTMDEIDALGIEYEDDPTIQSEAGIIMMELCPDVMQAMSQISIEDFQ